MKLVLSDYEAPVFDNKPANIVKWYDRHTHSYCIQVVNAEGDQIGDAYYAGNAGEACFIENMLISRYNL